MYSKVKIALMMGSVLFVSCDKETMVELKDDKFEFSSKNFAKDRIVSEELYRIEEYLNHDDKILLRSLSRLAKDVYKNPSLAQQFNQDPDSLLSKYGIVPGIELNINSPQIKAIMALSDKEVVEALEQKDFVRYLTLLENKGILTPGSSLSSITIRPKSGGTYGFRSMRDLNSLNDETELSPVVGFILLAGALIYVGAISITVVAIVAETWAAVHTSFGAYGVGRHIAQDSTYRLFLDKSGMDSKELFVSLHEKGYMSDEEFEKMGLNINK